MSGPAVSGPAAMPAAARVGPARVFLAVLWRDVFVTARELPAFLSLVVLQPLFVLFVFGTVLTRLGYAQASYVDVLFPGMVAFTAFLTGLQSCAFPLAIDFSFTREIEDRLLAPMPTVLVGLEKIAFAALSGLVAAGGMFPIGLLLLPHVPWRTAGLPLLLAGLVLGALVGAAIGLTLGTAVTPSQLNVTFAVVITPLLFTGATQYAWPSLSALRWFQVVTAVNPLTYASETLRGALAPQVPHIAPWICLTALVVALAVFTGTGIRGFRRRAVD